MPEINKEKLIEALKNSLEGYDKIVFLYRGPNEHENISDEDFSEIADNLIYYLNN